MFFGQSSSCQIALFVIVGTSWAIDGVLARESLAQKHMVMNKVEEDLLRGMDTADGDDAEMSALLAEDESTPSVSGIKSKPDKKPALGARHFYAKQSLDMAIEEYQDNYDEGEQEDPSLGLREVFGTSAVDKNAEEKKQVASGDDGDDKNPSTLSAVARVGRKNRWKVSKSCVVGAQDDGVASVPQCNSTAQEEAEESPKKSVEGNDIIKKQKIAVAAKSRRSKRKAGKKWTKAVPKVPHPPTWRAPTLASIKAMFQETLRGSGVNVTELRADPPVWQFDGFLSEEEISVLRSAAEPLLRHDAHSSAAKKGFRTAHTAWLSQDNHWQDPVQKAVDERVAGILGLPRDNQEPAQVLRYRKGEAYQRHHDLLLTQGRQPCGVRVATFFMYLSDVAMGGETVFPHLGLTVAPKMGRALLWWNVDPQAIEMGKKHLKDGRTEHEALLVQSGEKWGLNKWVHMRDFQTAYRSPKSA